MFYVNRIQNRRVDEPIHTDSSISSDDVSPMLLQDMPEARTPYSTPVEETEFSEPPAGGSIHSAPGYLPGMQPHSNWSDSDDSAVPGVSGLGNVGLSNVAPRAMPEDDDDEFFEAEDHPPSDGNSLMSSTSEVDLYRSLEDCQRAMSLFFSNKLDEAIAIMIPWKDISLYHAHGAAIFEFIPAMLTLDPIQIRHAGDALRRTFELCASRRRNYSLVQSISAMIKKPNYGGYTEEEAHAELIHAEAVLLQTCLGVLDGDELSGFIKASLRIKTAYASYKNCAKILLRKEWESETCKAHFESGVRLGLATFNVILSLLPPKVISVLEVIGFSADKEKGIEELKSGVKSPGLRSVLCELTLLIYYLVIGHFAAIIPDYFVTEQLISNGLRKYPDSVWFMMFKARMQLLRGMIPEALETYQTSSRIANLWPQLKHLCYWEMIWAYAIMMNWKEATWYAAKLASDSKWSRTIYMYTQAAMILQCGDGLSADQRKQSALLLRAIVKNIKECARRELAEREIPAAPEVVVNRNNTFIEKLMLKIWKATNYRQRLLGRSLPMEKFVIRRCERWIRRGYLALPGVELMCLWNIFPSLAAEPHYADQMLRLIEKTTDTIEAVMSSQNREANKKIPKYEKEDLALVHFLHGCLLNAMSLPRLALRHLEFVMTQKDDVRDGTHIIPYAAVEIAMCHYTLGDSYLAVELLQEARKKYTGYLLESRLHFRIHSKLELISVGAPDTVVAGTTASAVALSNVNALSTRPSTSVAAIASTSTRTIQSTTFGTRSTPSVDDVIRANRSQIVTIRSNPYPIDEIMANPGSLDDIRTEPSTSAETRANLNINTETRLNPATDRIQNTRVGRGPYTSTGVETRPVAGTSAEIRPVASTSAGSRIIPNPSERIRPIPSTSAGSSIHPSASERISSFPNTSAGARAIASTSARSRAIPSTSAESRSALNTSGTKVETRVTATTSGQTRTHVNTNTTRR